MTRIPRTDIDAFPLVLGGNTFGWTSDREQSFAVLDEFVAAGGNVIDSADLYSEWVDGHCGGESERMIGEWVAARQNRSEVVITTKVGGLSTRKGLSPENVELALHESLGRLRTNYIDIYYAHFDDPGVPIDIQVRTARSLVDSGRVRYIGLSNHGPERTREFIRVAQADGGPLPVALQPHYNLIHREEFERGYGPIAEEFDIAVFPYYALASGFLTGKYRSRKDFEGTARERLAARNLSDDGLAVVDALVKIGDERGAEPATVALAWLLAKGVTAPIASARTPEQLPALLAASDLTLTDEELDLLEAASTPFA